MAPLPVVAVPGAKSPRGEPDIYSRKFSLAADKGQSGDNRGDLCSCVPRHHGATANVAYAHHKSNGNVLDEWVFNFQRATHSPPFQRKTGERQITLSPVSTVRSEKRSLNLEKFFNFFLGDCYAVFDRPRCTSFLAGDLCIIQSEFVIKDEPPPLGFRQSRDSLP